MDDFELSTTGFPLNISNSTSPPPSLLSYNLHIPFQINSTTHSNLLPSLSILLVNKRLRSLALGVYFSENTFSLWPTWYIFRYPSPEIGRWVRRLVINMPLTDFTKRFTDSFVTRRRDWEVSVRGLPRMFAPRDVIPAAGAPVGGGQEGVVAIDDGDAVPVVLSSLTQWQTSYPLLKVVQFSFREGPCLNEKGKESFTRLQSEAVIRLSPVWVVVTCKARGACEKTGCQEDCFGLIERSIKRIIRLREDEG